MNSSTNFARSLVRFLIENGVSNFVLSPGSRNAPISIALYEAASKGLIDLHVKIDERGAAYFALGISKASNNYVALICTSGTAVANYVPAALESFHGQNKIIFLTADRPARLRNTGANQTTNQVNIFPGIKTLDLDGFQTFVLDQGPIHLNLQFDEPLIPSDEIDWLSGLEFKRDVKKEVTRKNLTVSGNGLVIVGHDKGGFLASEISKFAENLPLISEDPLNFPEALASASIFLADEKIRNFLKPDFVIVIGRTTLSRSINSFIANASKVFVIDRRLNSVDTKRDGDELFEELPILDLQNNSLDYRKKLEMAVQNSKLSLDWGEPEFARVFSDSIPDGSALFIGSSRPIRDIEAFAKPRTGLNIFSNRGLAGIDGNLSTVFGLATYFDKTFAVLGDLTFLHDITALLDPTKANCKIFVMDNNGGGIFSTLPQANVVGFEKIFGTPHNKNLRKIIEGFGIRVEEIKGVGDLKRAVIHNETELVIYLVKVPTKEQQAQKLRDYYASASSAVRIGFNLA